MQITTWTPLAIIVAALAGLPGCTISVHHPISVVGVNELVRCAGAGTGSITGRAAFHPTIGAEQPAQLETVTVYPESPAAQDVAKLRGQGFLVRVAPALQRQARTTTTDEHGRFTIEGLPPCTYRVVTQVTVGEADGTGSNPRDRVITGTATVDGGAVPVSW